MRMWGVLSSLHDAGSMQLYSIPAQSTVCWVYWEGVISCSWLICLYLSALACSHLHGYEVKFAGIIRPFVVAT